MKLSKSQKTKVLRAIEQHEKHKKSYFWTPFGNASNRRETERQNTWRVAFRHDGKDYAYESYVTCSCKNYYYNGHFIVDGTRRTVRAFAKLLGEQK
jgi:hypothetical protein